MLDLLVELLENLARNESQFLQPYYEEMGRYAKALFHAQQKLVGPFVRLDVEAVHRVAHGGFRLEKCGGEVVGEASASCCLMAGQVIVSGKKERSADLGKEEEVTMPGFILELFCNEDCEVFVSSIVERY